MRFLQENSVTSCVKNTEVRFVFFKPFKYFAEVPLFEFSLETGDDFSRYFSNIRFLSMVF